MKIVHISDTHGHHNDIIDMPDGDILVHSGDFTMAGSEREVVIFLNWFINLPYRHKIFVAGNHDACLLDAEIDGLPDSCHYLNNSAVTIDGIKFYGMPMFMADCVTGQQEVNIENIPEEVDVLITHQPPHKIMDYDGRRHYGSKTLLARVNEIAPRVHLFGHIHSGYGIESNGKTDFYNSAIVSNDYTLCNKPRMITI